MNCLYANYHSEFFTVRLRQMAENDGENKNHLFRTGSPEVISVIFLGISIDFTDELEKSILEIVDMEELEWTIED